MCCELKCKREVDTMRRMVNHQNFFTEDGKIYCRKLNKVTWLKLEICNTCEMCFGSLQGMGVECLWDDEIEDGSILAIKNPSEEKKRIDKLERECKLH
jgi:hypothetical protein